MKIGDIKNIKIARKYANALLESAIEADKADKVYNDLLFIAETINANPELANALLNPVVKIEDKKAIADKIFSIHTDKITIDFIFILIDSNRLNVLDEIINQYSVIYNEANNIVKPLIISAIELDETQKQKIVEKLQNKLMKTVQPEYIKDEKIIGGLIIEIGDKTIDCSLKTKFETMKKQLTKGNSYGNN